MNKLSSFLYNKIVKYIDEFKNGLIWWKSNIKKSCAKYQSHISMIL